MCAHPSAMGVAYNVETAIGMKRDFTNILESLWTILALELGCRQIGFFYECPDPSRMRLLPIHFRNGHCMSVTFT